MCDLNCSTLVHYPIFEQLDGAVQVTFSRTILGMALVHYWRARMANAAYMQRVKVL